METNYLKMRLQNDKNEIWRLNNEMAEILWFIEQVKDVDMPTAFGATSSKLHYLDVSFSFSSGQEAHKFNYNDGMIEAGFVPTRNLIGDFGFYDNELETEEMVLVGQQDPEYGDIYKTHVQRTYAKDGKTVTIYFDVDKSKLDAIKLLETTENKFEGFDDENFVAMIVSQKQLDGEKLDE